MSERKVITKYYPPDFDPSSLTRRRGPKATGPKVQTVRLMAPFSMRCTSCGEFIYKGRKFNARKVTPLGEGYLGIQIYRFHIKCTRCSCEITFRTDPKNNDYACERGAKRNTEPWRQKELADETDEQRLDRLEREMAEEEEQEERNAMTEVEAKTAESHREMAVADALDEIRSRNARIERADREGLGLAIAVPDDEETRWQEGDDAEYAKKAFAAARARALQEEKKVRDSESRPTPQWQWGTKRKPEDKGLLFPLLKKQAVVETPSKMVPPPTLATATTSITTSESKKAGPLVDYDSDSE